MVIAQVNGQYLSKNQTFNSSKGSLNDKINTIRETPENLPTISFRKGLVSKKNYLKKFDSKIQQTHASLLRNQYIRNHYNLSNQSNPPSYVVSKYSLDKNKPFAITPNTSRLDCNILKCRNMMNDLSISNKNIIKEINKQIELNNKILSIIQN